MTTYQVADWNESFETAKTRTYDNKSNCTMPRKFGLGFRKLMQKKSGPALYGAWCALVVVLSGHNKPRQGYCTDTGRIPGSPYSSDDLELLTGMPAKLFDEMFAECMAIGWVVEAENGGEGYRADTVGIPQSPIAPSNLNLNSNLNSNLNTNSNPKATTVAMSPPSVSDITDFAMENRLADHSQEFWNYYEANGWKVGRNPMKKWEAAYRNWCSREKKRHEPPPEEPISEEHQKMIDDIVQRERLKEQGLL